MFSFPNATRFAVALLLAGSLYTATQAQTTYVVTSLSDNAAQTGIDGNITLREAITAANTDAAFGDAPAGSGADIIDLTGLSGTITLEQGQFVITQSVTITGPGANTQVGANTLTIDANNADRHFDIAAGQTVTLAEVRLSNGAPPEITIAQCANGGAINSAASSLTLRNLELQDNSCMTQCPSGIGCNGGAVHQGNNGIINVIGSTFVGNSVGLGVGGGLALLSGATGEVVNSTFTENLAGDGGAIYSAASFLLANSTVMRNDAFDFIG
ncbi:MAG: hypothetical protein AAF752_12980, partial [Bacteroidota bacterium]